MKKIITALLGLTALAYADPQEVQKAPSPGFDQGYAASKQDMSKGYSYPARIDIDGWNVFVKGDYIYWKPYQELMDLGTDRVSESAPISDQYKNYRLKSGFSSGFKVGLGKSFDSDDWELYGEYTWLRPSKSTTTYFDLVRGGEGHAYFYNTWIVGTQRIPYDGNANPFNLYTNWKVMFDRGDIELARYYYSGTKLKLRPVLGWTFLRLDEKFYYEIRPVNYSKAYVHLKEKSFAFGPKIGSKISYMLGYGFHILADLNIGLMYANNSVKGDAYSQRTTFTHIGQDEVHYAKYKQTAIRDFQNLSLGLSWGTYFAKKRSNFKISAQYELQRYSNVNYMKQYMSKILVALADNGGSDSQILYPTDTAPGAYFTHGLTANTRFDF